MAPAPSPAITDPGASDVYNAWYRVVTCENAGSWTPSGSLYPDGVGITAANWADFGGGSDVSPAAQIAVAQRFAAHYFYPGYVPDQNGCAAW